MSPVPLALLEIAGAALVIVLFSRLSLSLWGDRWLVLVPVTIVAVTPLTLPSSVWWAAALNFVPLQLALVTSFSAAIAWSRSRRTSRLWWGFLAFLPLLAFSEKVVVVPWVMFAGLAVLDTSAGPLRVWVRALRKAPALWAAYAAVTVAYAIGYIHLVTQAPAGDPSAQQLSELLGRGIATSVVPGMFGGPLMWDPVGYGAAVGSPPAWLVIVSLELTGLLVVVSSAVSARARRAWVWAGAYLLGDLVLFAVGRLAPFVDPIIVQGLRYTADATIPLALAVGAALVAVGPTARRAVIATGWRSSIVRVAPRVFVLGLCGAVTVASIVSTARFHDIWRSNPSAVYVANATRDLATAKDGPAVIDQPVPESVLYGLAFPYNQVSWLLAPVQVRPDFGDPTTDLRVFDQLGFLRAATVDGPAALPGPVRGCGWAMHGSSYTVPLQTDIVDFSHTVAIRYVAGARTTASVALGSGPARQVTFTQGAGEVVLTLVGGGRGLRVTDMAAGVTVCTDYVRVGVPKQVAP